MSTTSPPVSSDSVTDVTIGVCLATAGGHGAGRPGCRRASTASSRSMRPPWPTASHARRGGGSPPTVAPCVRWSSATPTTSTPGSSATASASAATCSPRATGSTRTDWPALDGVDLVLTLGSEWNVYRPETAGAVDGRGGARARGRRAGTSRCSPSASAPRCCPTRSGGTVEPDADAGDRVVRPRPSTARPIAAGPWMEWHLDVFTRARGLRRRWPTNAVGPQLVAGRPVPRHAVPPRGHRDDGRAGGCARAAAPSCRDRGGDPDELLADDPGQRRAQPARPPTALVDWFLDDVARR